MRVLITGGSGLLGQNLNIELSKKHNILTLYQNNIGNCKDYHSEKIEINNPEIIQKIFDSFRPEIVIHTAAVSDAAAADKLPHQEVYITNVNATKNIAELCERYGAKLIYTSTDLVYAGYRGSMLDENAKLVPISIYAETKLMGEVKIRETFENYIILRTALMYGFGLNHSKCHFQQVYNDLKNRKEVNLFSDQFRSPLALFDAARMIAELIEKDVTGTVINFGGKERVSRFELGEILCHAAGFDKNLIIKTTMDEVEGIYKVTDVSMNINKLENLGINPISIIESIKRIIKIRL